MATSNGFGGNQPMWTEIHKLGSRLWQLQSERMQLVMVTSALRGDGKSTTVVYLAAALAQHPERRILALDLDFRHPSLGELFGVEASRGLADVLRGDCEFQEALVRSPKVPTLDICLPGQVDGDPLSLLSPPKLAELFRRLRPSYDLVLMDSPALIPVADGAALIPLVDGVIMAVMAGATKKHHFRRARELCLSLGANILGLVVGNVQEAAPEYMDTDYYGYASMNSNAERRERREGI